MLRRFRPDPYARLEMLLATCGRVFTGIEGAPRSFHQPADDKPCSLGGRYARPGGAGEAER
jgi:hypothetical protein